MKNSKKDSQYLLIVLNTTGFVQYKQLTEATLKYAPYIMEMSTLVSDRLLKVYRQPSLPEGVSISHGAKKFHGLAGKGKDDRAETIQYLANAIQIYDGLICHGGEFVVNVLKGEFMREGHTKALNKLATLPIYDTMLVHSDDGLLNYKKLEELYTLFTGKKPPSNIHSTEGRLDMLLEVWESGVRGKGISGKDSDGQGNGISSIDKEGKEREEEK